MHYIVRLKINKTFLFSFIGILITFGLIYFFKNLLTEYSSACQGVGALANVGLVYVIYRLSRNDSIIDFEKEANRKWYLDIIIPKFTEQIDNHIKKQEEELRDWNLKAIKLKELSKKITEYNYEEKELLNNIVYFDKTLYNKINEAVDEFYDNILTEMSMSQNKVNWNDKYIRNIKEHKNNIFAILYNHLKFI